MGCEQQGKTMQNTIHKKQPGLLNLIGSMHFMVIHFNPFLGWLVLCWSNVKSGPLSKTS